MTGPHGSYLMPSIYAWQLRHWLRAFRLEQFHIISSKSFQVHGLVVISLHIPWYPLFFFCDGAPLVISGAFQDDTKEEMRQLADFLQLPPSAKAAAVDESILRSRHRTQESSSKARSPGKLSAATAASLSDFFAPLNKELWELIGRKLDW
jgi:hypothetical protein